MMRKLLLCVLLTLLSCSAFAETNTKAINNILLKVNFNYQHNQKNNPNQYVINTNMKMETSNHQWIVVQDKENASKKNNILLLSKVEKSDLKTVKIQFLVLNTGKNPSIIAKPTIIVLDGQKAKMVIKEKNEIIQFDILATM